MERKIGETFEFKGKTYEVIESLRNICENCAFNGECDATETVVGRCSCTSRLDGKNVIFKEIKDNQLTINIPKGMEMEIDIENCDLKNGIIKFKKKELRYEDIENSLDLEGNRTGIPVDDNNAYLQFKESILWNEESWRHSISRCQIIKWAYLSDILPKKEGGEYARLNAKIAVLKEIAIDYSGKTIDSIIQQLEAIRKEVSND